MNQLVRDDVLVAVDVAPINADGFLRPGGWPGVPAPAVPTNAQQRD